MSISSDFLLPLRHSGISPANCRSKFNSASVIVCARVIESSTKLRFSISKKTRERQACDWQLRETSCQQDVGCRRFLLTRRCRSSARCPLADAPHWSLSDHSLVAAFSGDMCLATASCAHFYSMLASAQIVTVRNRFGCVEGETMGGRWHYKLILHVLYIIFQFCGRIAKKIK